VKRIALGLPVATGLFALAVALAPRAAYANGRFPEANHLFFSAASPDHVVMRTTFGFLDSKDRGATWRWVCEQAVPLGDQEDPMVAITPGNAIIATTKSGVAVSKNGACDWAFATGDLAEQWFVDLTWNPVDRSQVVAIASDYDGEDNDAGTLLYATRLWETKDDGTTWKLLGPALDRTLLAYTVDLAKSDPDRIHLTAVRNAFTPRKTFHFLSSTDHGATWVEKNVAFEGDENSLFIAAVDPNDADRVYVRTATNDVDKPTRLLLTEDGGANWKVVFRAKGALRGFALSEDGKRVYVGGPKDGIQVASTTDFAFEQTSAIEAQCLSATADGLWACSNERSGFIVALSKDEGRTFEKQTKFCDILGPLDCPTGTRENSQCPGRWPQQEGDLGCGDVPIGQAVGGDAGSGSQAKAAPVLEPGGGSDCRTAPASPFAALVSASAALGVIAAVVRRARRKR
jgi:photosystem II stability/assembly factor-like uncharacterized protein